MNLEKHISILLFQHDCVIVPDFGAFVGRKVNSSFQRETSLFTPPSKHIMFNPSLTLSDGLLVQQFAKAENISFEKASEEIDLVVKFWKNHLSSNAVLNLTGLGSISRSADGLMNFEANHRNYLTESYGLEEIRAKLILSSEGQNGSSTVWWKVAAMVPVLIGGFLYFGKPQPVTDFVNKQWSGFVSPVMNPNQEAVKVAETPVKTVNQEIFVYNEQKVADNTIYDYQVIAGAFKKIDEANSLAESLRQKGFEKARFTQKKGSFNYVAIQTFPTKEEALEYMSLHKEEIPQLWVFSLKD